MIYKTMTALLLSLFISIKALALVFTPYCQDFFLPPVAKLALEEMQELKIGTYNVLNLTESVGRYQDINGKKIFVASKDTKPLWQTKQIANAIREENLDIVVVQEVEGLRALERFNEAHLNNLYYPICLKGNDERGIDIGFLVKKHLPFEIQMESYKDLTWRDPLNNNQVEKIFSRDLPVMKIFLKSDSPRGPPDMILIGTHYKSQRSSGTDATSFKMREAQVLETTNIIKDLQSKYSSTPIMLAGDFNGDINNPEFKALTQNGLLHEALELKGIPKIDRVTHTYHPRNGLTQYSQLDAIMVTPNLKEHVRNAQVYRYKDQNGNLKPLPKTYEDREGNPSDHFMVNISIDFASWLRKKIPPP